MALAGSATHGGRLKITLGDTRRIRSASLISIGAVTHSQSTDQRRITLTTKQQGTSLTAGLPLSVNRMPPGDYLLTVVDAAGVPSPGQILTLRVGRAGTVTVNSATQVTGLVPATGDSDGSVPLTVGTRIGLEPNNYRDYRVQHENFRAYLRKVGLTSDAAARAGTSWTVRAGLASSSGISLESIDWPGYYLTAAAGGPGDATMEKYDGTAPLAGRATFVPVTGATGQNTSFQVFAQPGLLLRHQDFVLRTAALDGSDLTRADSTWAVKESLA